MVMMRTAVLLAALLAAPAPSGAQGPDRALDPDPRTEQELRALRRELSESLARGDRAALERILADGFMFVHSTGVVETREEYIGRAAAAGGTAPRPQFEFGEERIRVYAGTTAVWTARSVRRATPTSPEITLRSTDVLVKVDGRWRWASVHSTRLPTRPTPAAIDHAVLQGYLGEYEIAAGRTFAVVREGGVLRGRASGVRQSELIPWSETEFVWFSPDSNADMVIVFVRDENGKTTHAVLRREGAEAWRARKIR
jgi:hypothetical protein